MSRFIPIETPSGMIWAEIEETPEDGIILTGRTDHVFNKFEDAARVLKENADYLIKMFTPLGPQEVSISFGISIGVEAGTPIFGLAKVNGQSSYSVTLKWQASKDTHSVNSPSHES
jgi:hypothetical protein